MRYTLSIDTATVTAAGIVFTEPIAQLTGAGGQGTLVISTGVDRVGSCGGLPCTWADAREQRVPVNLALP